MKVWFWIVNKMQDDTKPFIKEQEKLSKQLSGAGKDFDDIAQQVEEVGEGWKRYARYALYIACALLGLYVLDLASRPIRWAMRKRAERVDKKERENERREREEDRRERERDRQDRQKERGSDERDSGKKNQEQPQPEPEKPRITDPQGRPIDTTPTPPETPAPPKKPTLRQRLFGRRGDNMSGENVAERIRIREVTFTLEEARRYLDEEHMRRIEERIGEVQPGQEVTVEFEAGREARFRELVGKEKAVYDRVRISRTKAGKVELKFFERIAKTRG